jgi:5-methylcytosine-specific restriction endonuclease McrA
MSDKINKTLQELGNARHFLTPFKRVYNKLVKHSKTRGIICNITYQQFLIFTKQEMCYYCHVKIPWKAHGKTANSYYLDRLDNNKGYTIENCVVCCWRCNNSKGDRYSHEEWFGMTSYFRNLKG